MKKSVLIQPLLSRAPGPMRVRYALNTENVAEGPVRAMQRFIAIALTTAGTDPFRPPFGTKLNHVIRMNANPKNEASKRELELFIRDNVNDAIGQFFIFQEAELSTLYEEDIITSIEIQSIEIHDDFTIMVIIRFYPKDGDAVTLSLGVN